MCTFKPNPNDVTLVPVIPVDGFIHNDHGFCYDPSCECHENEESIEMLNAAVQAGEASPTDADLIYHGKTV